MNGEGSADDAATAESSHAATLEEPDAESAESPTTAAASDAAAVVEAEERPPVKAPDALGGWQQTMAERMRAAAAAKAEQRAALDAMSPEERTAAAAAEAEAAQHKRRRAKHLRKSVRVTGKGAASIRANLMKGRRRGGGAGRASSDKSAALGAPPPQDCDGDVAAKGGGEAWICSASEERDSENTFGGTVNEGGAALRVPLVPFPPPPREQTSAAAARPAEIAAPLAPSHGGRVAKEEPAASAGASPRSPKPSRPSRAAPAREGAAHSPRQRASSSSSAVEVPIAAAVRSRETLNPLSVLDGDMLNALAEQLSSSAPAFAADDHRVQGGQVFASQVPIAASGDPPLKAGAGRPLPPIPTQATAAGAGEGEGSVCCAIT